jgi:hypothetical protein
VKGADVAWSSEGRWSELAEASCFVRAPEICVKVLSPENTERQIREKTELYFDAGAQEVWVCGTFGRIDFFAPGPNKLMSSRLCPAFFSKSRHLKFGQPPVDIGVVLLATSMGFIMPS